MEENSPRKAEWRVRASGWCGRCGWRKPHGVDLGVVSCMYRYSSIVRFGGDRVDTADAGMARMEGRGRVRKMGEGELGDLDGDDHQA
ncbi:hypothetical protein GGTG_04635 [Gaeumannomyces tritici R3-111a-1]|uniref:Uncharacterized protein n=1 Tax=Gaeumannomyces tritici (strain R3-111a-1) TaxID=644352 RepID=J3NTN5_GAET3|nr:hypothetical protein GGTG_04635 [Gaeumannomyces tritici R3-111a-1]EJT79550.1 hypothetical protein GGTG_04635 [Gaeumannomyces tritici R3-111a-1]